MEFEITRDELGVRFKGYVPLAALAALDLRAIDRQQLSEPGKAPADHLLDLELVYRRHAEHMASRKRPGREPALTRNDVEYALRMYRKTNMSIAAIARTLRVSPGVVTRIVEGRYVPRDDDKPKDGADP